MTTLQEGTPAGVAFESFFHEGMRARYVPAAEERFPEQTGLLPIGEEDLFAAEADEPTDAGIMKLAEWYQRHCDDSHNVAMLGRMGVTLSIHEAPQPYAVLALEKPAHYHGLIRTPGIVICAIDVLEGPLRGRYLEKHPYETPPAAFEQPDEAAVAPRTKPRPVSLTDIRTIQNAGRATNVRH